MSNRADVRRGILPDTTRDVSRQRGTTLRRPTILNMHPRNKGDSEYVKQTLAESKGEIHNSAVKSFVAVTMFWKFDLNTTSHVDKLLDKEDVTLRELMDEDDVLQECKAQNQKLLGFLCRQQCMEELVSLITRDPPLDMEEKVRFKYPNTACELLTCDVPQINDRLGGDETLLNLLYDFLDHEPPLNPLLASFFSKTIGNLIARKTEQVIQFLKKKDGFVGLVLKHLGTSALMDLLLRLVSCVEPAGLRRDVLHWLNGEKIIQRLVQLIHPSQDEDDLFFKYTWNNFLHFQVELCIAAILSHAAREDRAGASGPDSGVELLPGNGDPETPQPAASCPENTMVTHLFQKCCLVQRILEAWEANDHAQAAGGTRRGNMGHLTRIANAVAQNLEKGPVRAHISDVLRGLPADCRGRWDNFVEETLAETNRRNAVDLVSTHHLHPSSEDEDMEGVFPNELSLQQAFSEYQVQQMTATFVDQFGFNDEEFADQDDSVNAPFDRIAEINFSIDADEDSPSTALFEACCGDRIQPFDDDEEEDIWEDEGTHRAARVTARARFGGPHTSESCSKNGLQRGGQDRKEGLEADKDAARARASLASTQKEGPRLEGGSEEGTSWAVFDEPVNSPVPAPGVAVDVGSSVWAASTHSPSTSEEKGWAKFTDFQPFCCSESGPRCSSPVDTGHGDTQEGPNQGPERARPASPCAWSACVTRKAPLVVSDNSEDQQKTAGALEAISLGPSREAPPPSASVPRAECAGSLLSDPTSPAPAEATFTLAVAVPAEAAVAATPAPSKAGPTPATMAGPPGPAVAVTTAAPATCTAAMLGTVTKDKQTDSPPPAGAALNGPM
ncbi:serine/threonine-protein phosphatase 6 regulatory subunit 2 isoform X7 [Mustela putorius furo]|uniref:Serine/threonine-protein phosphatase 6 regulatory subunit 2 isoform X7 n=1 Tax=Mustela putorius furo TaxID=9669 RepID=A0A8U0SLE6_MUSPF|nr:serine/threonine-protein phosphatase 6 regulatory subunit 2 isoform X7 [Mustela putorius furo]